MSDHVEVLHKALDHLEDGDKWIKGNYYADGHRHCVAGAIYCVTGGSITKVTRAGLLANQVLGRALVDEFDEHSVTVFNDLEATTFDDIRRMFKRALDMDLPDDVTMRHEEAQDG